MSEAIDGRLLADIRRSTGANPEFVARAPGRVELLGNHTDYNGGLVLAAAVDRFTTVAGTASAGTRASVLSLNMNQGDTFDLAGLNPESTEPQGWARYVRGVAWALQADAKAPLTSAFDVTLVGNVPIGGGLSSSASLQAALGSWLVAAGLVPGRPASTLDDDAGRMDLARVLRRSENDFVGVGSGLLDQASVLLGRTGHALRLDCRTLAFERLSLGDPAPAIVVCDSTTSRQLAEGMYNRRRAECDRVVDFFRARNPEEGVTQLRDVSLGQLMADWELLDGVGRLRARHVLTENLRVEEGTELLRIGDVEGFGRLMSASHRSSRDDFENSSRELDALVESAQEAPGFLGGKLSGAGWAGCTVNLVRAELAEEFASAVIEGYRRRTGLLAGVSTCQAAQGATAAPFAG
ncbi:galactokinase [Isosphaeraceae bacterium EP7]